ncbi:MAG: tyrosine-type recombinase/integrase [Planctomycetota bacterium]|jgi:site-specific recombinase XerD
MASLGYDKLLRRWRVRWRAKKRGSAYIFQGSRVFFEKRHAVKFFADIEAQEKLVRSGEVSTSESIDTAHQDFLQHCKRHTKRTQQHYSMVMSRFIASLPNSLARIQQIEAVHIQEYLYQLRDQGLLNRTLNAHLTTIKSFCRFYAGRYKINNPAAEVKPLVEEPPDARFLAPDEYNKIMELATPLAKDRLLFLAHTGLRATEFYELNLKSISPDGKTLTVKGKGRKRRHIPLNKTAREVLPRIAPATPNALLLMCYRTAEKAKIPQFGPHAMRHWFATQLLIKGVPIAKVSKLLGHASIRTTEQAYAHILPADLANATDVLDMKIS